MYFNLYIFDTNFEHYKMLHSYCSEHPLQYRTLFKHSFFQFLAITFFCIYWFG